MLTKHTQELVDAFGFLYQEEAELLQMHSELIPENGVCVNIGAGVGTSSLAVLEKRPNLTSTFYTVDITCGGSPYGGLGNERNAFDKAGMEYPKQICGDSKEIGKNWTLGKVDFLIIDGDHSEKGIRGDISAWEPHLKKNSIVFVHDYHSVNWKDVHKVVDELMLNNDKYKLLDQVKTYISFVYTGEQEK
jgi:hypothetical protein